MSMEHLAELLNVDEVRIEHGPKGYGLTIRLADVTMNGKVDYDDIKKSGTVAHPKPKMHVVAEKLVHLTDTLLHGVSRSTIAKAVPLPARDTRYIPMEDARYTGRQMLRFADAPPAPYQPPLPAALEPAATVPMASRFHAIVAELEKM